MKYLIPWAVLLLLVAVLTRWGTGEALEDRHAELGLLVLSRGQLLPVEEDAVSQRYGISDGIITAEEVYRFTEPGLRVAMFNGALKLVTHRNFDVAHKTEDVKALLVFCRDAPNGAILVFSQLGSLYPAADEDTLAEVYALIGRMGAGVNPFEGKGSWCMVSLRRRDHWYVLGESFARNRNAHLAWSVTARQREGKRGKGFFVDMSSANSGPVNLLDNLATAKKQGLVWFDKGRTLGERRLDAFRVMPVYDKELKRVVNHELHWAGVQLPAGSRFRCEVALHEGARDKSDGVAFVVLVNGEEVGRKVCLPTEDGFLWQPFEVPLPVLARADLRLVIDTLADGRADYALWGQPQIDYGTGVVAPVD